MLQTWCSLFCGIGLSPELRTRKEITAQALIRLQTAINNEQQTIRRLEERLQEHEAGITRLPPKRESALRESMARRQQNLSDAEATLIHGNSVVAEAERRAGYWDTAETVFPILRLL